MKRKLLFDKTSSLYLGLASDHDFSACIIKNGKIVRAIEAERINRAKHSLNVFNAFDSCLKYLFSQGRNPIHALAACDTINLSPIKDYLPKVRLFDHHLCHAAAAFYTSPYNDAAILVIDGAGSNWQLENGNYVFNTVSLYVGEGTRIRLLKKVFGTMDDTLAEKDNFRLDIPNSVGIFYTYVTKIIGFNFLDDGKTMGLASYGDPTVYYSLLRKHFDFQKDGTVSITWTDADAVAYKKMIDSIEPENKKFHARADFAASAQRILEEVYFHYLNLLFSLTGKTKLCVGGGVALNSLANGKIKQNTPFTDVYFFPACGDNALSVGAAYLQYYKDHKKRVVIRDQNPFLGKTYSRNDITHSLDASGLRSSSLKNVYTETAKLLDQGSVIAWFQGGSEFGPRALGHRSILANPKNGKTKDYINKVIKQREWFRPLAPMVLYDFQQKYFRSNDYVPYMLQVVEAQPEHVKDILAVLHVDKTARVQSITRANTEMFRLLTAFHKIAKVPVLLNTSFNTRGMPIVETPQEAIDCFKNSKIDYLVIGNFLCSKK